MYNNNNDDDNRESAVSGGLTTRHIASCGLRLNDKAIRVAVALRLGLDLGAPHTCRCGALVDARGQHGLVFKQARSR